MLDDLEDAAEAAEELVGRGRAAWDADRLLRLAGEAVIGRIADASNRLPDEVKGAVPDVPWDDIRDIRILVDHIYHRVDYEALWETLATDARPPRSPSPLARFDGVGDGKSTSAALATSRSPTPPGPPDIHFGIGSSVEMSRPSIRSRAMTAAEIRVGSVVIDCNDFPRMLAFWQEALHYVPRDPPEDDWAVLRDPGGRNVSVSLQLVPEPRVGKNRLHFDLYTPDRDGEVERLLGVGATIHPRTPEPDEDFIVLADPEGNLFCVVQTDR